jgi:hypothetical protein
MRYLGMAIIAVVLAPFLLAPVFLIAIAAGPVLASLLLIVSTGLVMYGVVKLVRVLGGGAGRLFGRAVGGGQIHRVG